MLPMGWQSFPRMTSILHGLYEENDLDECGGVIDKVGSMIWVYQIDALESGREGRGFPVLLPYYSFLPSAP